MWSMFPSEMLFSFDVCGNGCATLSLRLPKNVTCWRDSVPFVSIMVLCDITNFRQSLCSK